MTTTKIQETKELVSITAEFFISLVVLIGGGFLLYTGASTEMAASSITAVITFWFIRRQTESQAKQQRQQTEVQQTEIRDINKGE